MKANELRIGNFVETKRGISKVFVLTIDNVVETENKEYDVKPIPLTEEWLLKFGFEEYEFEDEIFGYVLNDFGYVNEFQFMIRIFIDFEGILIQKPIKYVHQLQNLYFALTGEELKQQEQ